MKNIPFVANHKDNMHCAMAVFRMVNQYYFSQDLTWQQIDKIAHTQKGKGSWTFPMELYLAKKGLQILNIEPVDYELLSVKGPEYIKQVEGNKVGEYYLNKTNLRSVIKYIPDYLIHVNHETRRASVKEVVGYLRKGYLITVEVDSARLFKYEGYELHLILLYGLKGKSILANDPGLPPVPHRIMTLSEFNNCFAYKGASQAIVVFKGLKKV
jgi:hypothetical protein